MFCNYLSHFHSFCNYLSHFYSFATTCHIFSHSVTTCYVLLIFATTCHISYSKLLTQRYPNFWESATNICIFILGLRLYSAPYGHTVHAPFLTIFHTYFLTFSLLYFFFFFFFNTCIIFQLFLLSKLYLSLLETIFTFS